MMEERHNVAFMLGVILGALAAAIAAALFTPASGKETREQFSALVSNLRSGAGSEPGTPA